MFILIQKIHEQALNRPPGYLASVMAVGKVVGDYLKISREDLAALRVTYRGPENTLPPGCPNCGHAEHAHDDE